MRLGVAFDFDGVLYETYSGALRALSAWAVGRGLNPQMMLLLDDILEELGVWDRRRAYGVILGEPELHDILWAARVSHAKPLAVQILPALRSLGLRLYIVCGADSTVDEKLRRVHASGVHLEVDDVVVYPPGALREYLELLVETEGLERLIYVDDKPGNTCRAAEAHRVKTIWFASKPWYPRAYSWRGGGCGLRVHTPSELLEAILSLLR